MKKSDVLEMGKNLVKIHFKDFNTNIQDSDIIVIGLKDNIDDYVMVFALLGVDDILCRMFYNKKNNKIRTEMFKKYK